MTAQISDAITYQDDKYALVGISGTGLFDPETEGLEARFLHTGCWAGFICEYAVKENTLRLHKLTLGLDDKKPLPLLWGHVPKKNIEYFYKRRLWFGKRVVVPQETGEYCYIGLDALIEYTGGLLIGSSFIRTMYVHQGFQKAYRYENVYELTFEKGALIAARDVSDAMAAYRRELYRRRAAQGEPSEQDMKDWLTDCYDQDYSKWFQ